MSRNYKYSPAEDNYIRAKLDELATSPAGRLLETSEDVADYLDELGLGKAFSDYFEDLPRAERRKIVDDYKQKYHDYHARPGRATATVARGRTPSDSAYGSRGGGTSGIEPLRQADEYSDCANDTFEIYLIDINEGREVMKPMRARYDTLNSANVMCLTTAQSLWGRMVTGGPEMTISWRRTKDDPKVHKTPCQLRELVGKENEDVNVVFGSEMKSSGSTIGSEPPDIEDPALEQRRAKLRAKYGALMAEEFTEIELRKERTGR